MSLPVKYITIRSQIWQKIIICTQALDLYLHRQNKYIPMSHNVVIGHTFDTDAIFGEGKQIKNKLECNLFIFCKESNVFLSKCPRRAATLTACKSVVVVVS